MSATEKNGAKKALRDARRAAVAALSVEQRGAAGSAAVERLQEQEVWRQARSVLLFAPLPDELDVWPLAQLALTAGKVVALPRYERDTGAYGACRITKLPGDLCEGRFGVREPLPECEAMDLKRLDLVLAPGLAFDLHGCRLGRGKGFYDRLLMSVRGTICGVAYDQQILGHVPAEPHDIHVHCILTPTRWIDLQAARRF